MIRDQWYAVAESRSVRRDRPLGLVRLGERIVLFRAADGRVVCLEDRCCHRGAALSPGRIVDAQLDPQIECPYHGFRFDADGRCTHMPCQGAGHAIPKSYRVARFPVRERHGLVWMWWGDEREELPEPPWFEDLPDSVRGTATHQEEWPFHFTRVMEQMFDLHHAPFAHRTIGGGLIFGKLIEDVSAELEGDLIRYRGAVRRTPGTGGVLFDVAARLAIARVSISPKVKSVVTVTPIDGARSWIFVRLFQGFTRVPGLRWLLSYLLLLSDFRLAQPQDRRVIASQVPAVSDLRAMKLVAADRGVLLWHKLYRRLLHLRIVQRVRQRPEPSAGGGA